jgi:hypothetical protein
MAVSRRTRSWQNDILKIDLICLPKTRPSSKPSDAARRCRASSSACPERTYVFSEIPPKGQTVDSNSKASYRWFGGAGSRNASYCCRACLRRTGRRSRQRATPKSFWAGMQREFGIRITKLENLPEPWPLIGRRRNSSCTPSISHLIRQRRVFRQHLETLCWKRPPPAGPSAEAHIFWCRARPPRNR